MKKIILECQQCFKLVEQDKKNRIGCPCPSCPNGTLKIQTPEDEKTKVAIEEVNIEEYERIYTCDDCGHFISMHGDNGECYSCPKDICQSLN